MQRSGFNNARVRQANKQIFLSHLWREKQLSKSQLAQLTSLSIPAVSNILEELMDEGRISHSRETLSQRGLSSGSYHLPEKAHGRYVSTSPLPVSPANWRTHGWLPSATGVMRSLSRKPPKRCCQPWLHTGGNTVDNFPRSRLIWHSAFTARLIRSPAHQKPCPRPRGKHRWK